MEILERVILSTMLVICCLLGLYHARAMQKDRLEAQDENNSQLFYDTTNQLFINQPQTRPFDVSKDYDATEKRDGRAQSGYITVEEGGTTQALDFTGDRHGIAQSRDITEERDGTAQSRDITEDRDGNAQLHVINAKRDGTAQSRDITEKRDGTAQSHDITEERDGTAQSLDITEDRDGTAQLHVINEKTDGTAQSRNTRQVVLQAIHQAEWQLTAEVNRIFDIGVAVKRRTHATENNEIGLHDLESKPHPLSFSDLKNSLQPADCEFDGSNSVCKDRNIISEPDMDRRKLANTTSSNIGQHSETNSKLLMHGDDFYDEFLRNLNPGETGIVDTGTRKKRFFGRVPMVTCNLDTVALALRFSEYIGTEAGSLELTCSGHVQVTKCEGVCSSRVTPSVNHVDGFEKVCSCCRDVATRSRAVTLTSCVLGTQEVVGYSLSRDVVEPITCACRECRN